MITDLGLLSRVLHSGEGWGVTTGGEEKTVPVTCWDGVGSWRQVMLVSSCETSVKTLFLFLILLLCGSFLLNLSRAGLLVSSKPLSVMIRQ